MPAWWSHPCLLSHSDSDQIHMYFISAWQRKTKPSEPQRESSALYRPYSYLLPKSFNGQNIITSGRRLWAWELHVSFLNPVLSALHIRPYLPYKPCLICSLNYLAGQHCTVPYSLVTRKARANNCEEKWISIYFNQPGVKCFLNFKLVVFSFQHYFHVIIRETHRTERAGTSEI